MKRRDEFLWVEKYRPRTVRDTILPDSLKRIFQDFVDKKNIPNLLLTGKSGMGKTTIARAMIEEIGSDYMIFNGSLNADKETLRNEMQQFASSVSFTGGRKYIILDEADYLTHHIQPALRNFMEEYSNNCGFILTCNFKNKILPPLISRCSVVDFVIDGKESVKLASQFHKRCVGILKCENIEADPAIIAQLVKRYYPDWRKVLNEMQKYSALGKIDAGILTSNDSGAYINSLMEDLKSKNFMKLRTWVAENTDIDQADLHRKLYESADKYMTPPAIAQMILILAKYQYQAAFVMDAELNTIACLTEIMINADWKN